MCSNIDRTEGSALTERNWLPQHQQQGVPSATEIAYRMRNNTYDVNPNASDGTLHNISV